ncbi:MAG: serine/threonine-protein kinase [Aureliella sp.]
MSSSHQPRSDSSAALGNLTVEQQVRLTEVLDEYLQQLENHESPSREALLAQHPELAEVLAIYLDKLEQLHGMTSPAGLGPLVGQTLGDYQLVAEIGRGGMGIVFSARDQKLDRLVAIKLLPMADLLEEKHVERFRNEARAAANLQHPHIVPVFSIGQQGGIHYFAMRLIDGPSLDQRIAQHAADGTKPPTERVLRQFAEVAGALHAAHEHGIVHRDIKPSNLLLDSQNSLWIADFGLARFQTATPLTQTGDMIGTMRYMSPEQATGRGELVDHRTDIYSLGATLFEVLTQRPVIEGEDGPGLLRTIATQPTPSLRKLRPDCPTELQTVLNRAMSPSRDDRYASASELAADLQAIVDGRPIAARPISPLVRVSRWANANAMGLAIACGLLLIAAGGLSIHNWMILNEAAKGVNHAANARASVLALSKVADDLASVPGGEQIRRKVLWRSLNYFQDFAAHSAGDPSLLADTASAHARIGAIQEELGDSGQAIVHYELAEQMYEKLIAADPSASHLVRLRNENLNHLGLALSNAGDLTGALKTLETAVSRQRDAASSSVPETLALTLSNYGVALQKANRRNAAREAYSEAIELLTEAHAAQPDDPAITRGLAAAHQNYGSVVAGDQAEPAFAARQSREAIEHLNRALQLQIELAAVPENKLRISRDLITTYLHLGDIQLANRSLRDANHSFQAASIIAEQLVTLSPGAPHYLRDLATSKSNLGMTLYQQGNKSAALEALEDAETHYRKLLKLHPSNPQIMASLGISLNNQAIALQDIGNHDAAEATYAEAANQLVAARQQSPSQSNQRALDRVYVNHVRMLYYAGRQAEADALIEKRIDLVGPIVGGHLESLQP